MPNRDPEIAPPAAVPPPPLSRRERQLLDILYRLGEGSVADVRAAMDDAPGYSAVRALLNLLREKGHVLHRQVDRKYVYRPAEDTARASRGALSHIVRTFFGGSIEGAVASLLDAQAGELDAAELDRIGRRIEAAREAAQRTSRQNRPHGED